MARGTESQYVLEDGTWYDPTPRELMATHLVIEYKPSGEQAKELLDSVFAYKVGDR